jgi:hypothetical protein
MNSRHAPHHWIKVFAIALLLAPAIACADQPKKFLVFDYALKQPWIKDHANQYVFVWGSSPANEAYFKKYSPLTELSTYYPYARDPNAKNNLSNWRSTHPNWIAYKCDGTSPAVFVGDKNIPLDITSQQTIKWQISNFLSHAKEKKTVALDNFQFRNVWGACGSYDATHNFVKRYTGNVYDPTYASDVAAWINTVSAAMHKNGYRVIVNHIPDSMKAGKIPGADVDSPNVKKMIASVDGMVDEKTDYILKNKDISLSIFKLANYAAQNGKWMYFVYQLDPLDARTVESAMASYLIMASEKTAVYLSHTTKTYGHEPNFFGYDRTIGTACGAYKNDHGQLTRQFTRGVAIFMLPDQPRRSVKLPAGFSDINNKPISGMADLTGGEGLILYRRDGTTCTAISPAKYVN